MAQGVPRWPRKLETEQELEFAISLLSAILFVLSNTVPYHHHFYSTSLMGQWLWRTFLVRQWVSKFTINCSVQSHCTSLGLHSEVLELTLFLYLPPPWL